MNLFQDHIAIMGLSYKYKKQIDLAIVEYI